MSLNQLYNKLTKEKQEEIRQIYDEKCFSLIKDKINQVETEGQIIELEKEIFENKKGSETRVFGYSTTNMPNMKKEVLNDNTEKECRCLNDCDCSFCRKYGSYHLLSEGKCRRCGGKITKESSSYKSYEEKFSIEVDPRKEKKKIQKKRNNCNLCKGTMHCPFCVHGNFRDCVLCQKTGTCPACEGKKRITSFKVGRNCFICNEFILFTDIQDHHQTHSKKLRKSKEVLQKARDEALKKVNEAFQEDSKKVDYNYQKCNLCNDGNCYKCNGSGFIDGICNECDKTGICSKCDGYGYYYIEIKTGKIIRKGSLKKN